jgi:putative membrane protein
VGDDREQISPAIRQMVYRQAAWCYALSRNLRGQDPIKDLHSLLSTAEIESYQGSHNVPNALLQRQGSELRDLFDQDGLDLYAFVELERTLSRLTNSMGGCERIKNTPFPASYSRMVHGMIYIFVLFLPFGLFNVPAAVLVATSLSLSYGCLLIDRVAMYLQDPFSNRPSDTPMLSLSRTIEINIRQMLEETQLPEKPLPVDGVLY